MLSKKQNYLETIHGGKPDRFVNQFEAYANVIGIDPLTSVYPIFCAPGEQFVDAWGVTITFAEGTPGPFPLHDDQHRLLKDITKWREVIKAPSVDFDESAWKKLEDHVATINRDEQFVMLTYLPGIFEQLHYFMGMEDTFINFYEEPEEVKALIDFLVDFELSYISQVIDRVHPDAFFQDDDWGSARSTFLSPEQFREFFLEPYQRIYGYVHDHGVEVIIHHSDSYVAPLIPTMIEMGIDVYQGCMTTNNTPELIKKYGGQISFQGDLDNGTLDIENWTEELIAHEVERACTTCGKLYFIPSLIQAGPMSTYEGVDKCVSREIDRMSKKLF